MESISRNYIDSSPVGPWEFFRDKTVMVTGGGGFLAAYLVKTLLYASNKYELNVKIVAITRSIPENCYRLLECTPSPNFRIFKHDLNAPLPPDFPTANIVIHSASQASPKYFGTDPVGTIKTNSIGTMFLLDHAVQHNAERFLFFSSGEVYGELPDSSKTISEDDYGFVNPLKLRSSYAESKRLGETMCVAWEHQYGLPTLIVRPFHTYGPGMSLDDGRVFADFVADVVAKRDITVKSDGSAFRLFCYLTDATLGFLTVLLKGEFGQAYNIANPKAEISVKELARTISGLFPERNLGVRFENLILDGSYLKSSIVRQVPSIEKAIGLGWEPVVDVPTGFKRTILSYLE